MSDTYYFLDNNVISHLSKVQLASAFFKAHCRVPSEVFHEAGANADLRVALYPTTAVVLLALCEVMASIRPDDTSLVDLYANKGNADPLLVACALVEIRLSESFLVKPTWCVVTNDAAVRAKANDFSIETLSREEFFAAIDSAWGIQSWSSKG